MLCRGGSDGAMREQQAALIVQAAQRAPIPLAVNLSCREGELVALIGPSGSGKSTTLRIVAGLYQPKVGRVECKGAVWLDTSQAVNLPPHHRRVGFVFQTYALFPHMTAIDNVKAALGHRSARERDDHAKRLLALVRLDGLGSRRPAELSGGQQQRVAVARALAREPAVLLLDEPFAAVDRRTRRSLQVEMVELRKKVSVPILLVTHDIDEATALADRVCVIDAGDTLQIGTPQEIMAAPNGDRVSGALDLPSAESAIPADKPGASF